MDCFVAVAPRNDDEEGASLSFRAGSLLAPVVIASGAKQSISRLAEAWIASSLSLLAMTMRKQRRFHFQFVKQRLRPAHRVPAARRRPSDAVVCTPGRRGRRECRVFCAPAA